MSVLVQIIDRHLPCPKPLPEPMMTQFTDTDMCHPSSVWRQIQRCWFDPLSSGPSLQWRRNGRDGVSNHQPHDCLLNRLFGCRSKKTSKFTGHRPPVNSPQKWPVTRKVFPFDDVIMITDAASNIVLVDDQFSKSTDTAFTTSVHISPFSSRIWYQERMLRVFFCVIWYQIGRNHLA